MLSWLSNPTILAAGVILAAVQFAAALPWLWAIDPRGFERTTRSGRAVGTIALGLLAAGLGIAAFIGYNSESAYLERFGRYAYGAVLHLQLLIDLFLLLPQLLVLLWPKAGAVAQAAYREGWRQSMFWLIIVFGIVGTWFAVVIPYFTFGEDYRVMKQIGFDVVMLTAVLFGVLAASISISEEIEGRTAITVMSKPVNRRQFLIGKYLGILMACLAMSLVLSWNLNFALRAMREYDPINNTPDPAEVTAEPTDKVVDPMTLQAARTIVPTFQAAVPSVPGRAIGKGVGLWFADALAHTLGLLLGFGQVTILVAIASALATRIPFVVNLVLCLVVYFLGHLAPVIVKITESRAGGDDPALGLVGFLGRLFDVLLPALEFFNMGPAIIRESPLDLWQFGAYVLTVWGYSLLYTAIVLIVGLLLFEDRDLA